MEECTTLTDAGYVFMGEGSRFAPGMCLCPSSTCYGLTTSPVSNHCHYFAHKSVLTVVTSNHIKLKYFNLSSSEALM